jgi:hypothetical protein
MTSWRQLFLGFYGANAMITTFGEFAHFLGKKLTFKNV